MCAVADPRNFRSLGASHNAAFCLEHVNRFKICSWDPEKCSVVGNNVIIIILTHGPKEYFKGIKKCSLVQNKLYEGSKNVHGIEKNVHEIVRAHV